LLKSFVTYEDWKKIDKFEVDWKTISTKIWEKLLWKKEYANVIGKKLTYLLLSSTLKATRQHSFSQSVIQSQAFTTSLS